MIHANQICPACNGAGFPVTELEPDPCWFCSGTGIDPLEENVIATESRENPKWQPDTDHPVLLSVRTMPKFAVGSAVRVRQESGGLGAAVYVIRSMAWLIGLPGEPGRWIYFVQPHFAFVPDRAPYEETELVSFLENVR